MSRRGGADARLLRRQVARIKGDRCSICHGYHGMAVTLTLDHILPLSRGGHNGLSNLRLVCETCHRGLNDHDQCRAVVLIALSMGAAWAWQRGKRKREMADAE